MIFNLNSLELANKQGESWENNIIKNETYNTILYLCNMPIKASLMTNMLR